MKGIPKQDGWYWVRGCHPGISGPNSAAWIRANAEELQDAEFFPIPPPPDDGEYAALWAEVKRDEQGDARTKEDEVSKTIGELEADYEELECQFSALVAEIVGIDDCDISETGRQQIREMLTLLDVKAGELHVAQITP